MAFTRMLRPARAAAILPCLLLAVTAAACGSSDDGGSAGGGKSKPVRLYVLGAFSGPAAAQNVPVLRGAKIATKVLNDRGGIHGRKVELVVKDDRGELASMVNSARKAANDHDGYGIFVGNGSPGASAVQPIFARSKQAVFSVATSPAVSTKDWPGFFRMNTLATDDVRRSVQYGKQKGSKGVGILWVSNDYGSGMAKATEAAAKSVGVPIKASVSVSPESTNLAPEIGKLKDAGVDYVVGALVPAQTLAAAKAAKAINYPLTMQFNGADMAFPAIREVLGADGAGVLFRYMKFPLDPSLQTKPDMPVDQTKMSDEAKVFWPAWSAAFGGKANIAGHQVGQLPPFDWWSYDGAMMVAKAIEAGASSPEDVVAGIDKIKTFDLVASYDFNADHLFHPPADLRLARIEADGTVSYDIS